MPEDFETEERCKSWWNPPRDFVLLSSSPCSMREPNGIEGRSFSDCSAGVAETIKIARSSKEVNDDDDDDDGRSTSFQDDFMHRSHQIDCMMETTSLHMMEFDLLSASFDWNLAVLQANGIDDSSATNSKLRVEDMASSNFDYDSNQEKEVTTNDSSHQIQTNYWQSHCSPNGMPTNGQFTSCVYPSNSIQSSLEAEYHQHQQLPFNNQQQFSGLHFDHSAQNASSFINASSCAQYVQHTLEEKHPSCPETSCEDVRDSNSMVKKIGVQPAFKRPRFETPSALPTFKVRKDKLGDRVTALQQLVSPFGKTDTASVLHEAIEYIEYLHSQVSVLCSPYIGNGAPVEAKEKQKDDQEGSSKLDLRSRGLCLVPISSTFPVATSTMPAFLGADSRTKLHLEKDDWARNIKEAQHLDSYNNSSFFQ